jgi:hypothetical protein
MELRTCARRAMTTPVSSLPANAPQPLVKARTARRSSKLCCFSTLKPRSNIIDTCPAGIFPVTTLRLFF